MVAELLEGLDFLGQVGGVAEQIGVGGGGLRDREGGEGNLPRGRQPALPVLAAEEGVDRRERLGGQAIPGEAERVRAAFDRDLLDGLHPSSVSAVDSGRDGRSAGGGGS